MTRSARDSDIICLSTNHWTGLPTSKQHLMSVLAETRRVLYVDPPLDVFSVLGRRRRWSKLRGLRAVGSSIHVLSPVLLSSGGDPERRSRFYEGFAPSIRSAARSLGMDEPVVWAFGPEHAACAGRLGGSLLVYQASDEPSAFGRRPEIVKKLEGEMLARADVVFGVSSSLVEARSAANDNVHRLPNAADRRHYSRVLAGREDVGVDEFMTALIRHSGGPKPLRGLPRPLVMYGGAAYRWFDSELFLGLARLRPEWTFLLVGPAVGKVAGAGLPGNVLSLGRRPYDEFPLYVAACDAAVIPWLDGPFSVNADPIVLYEHLLCGKPVVATPFPAARERGEFVRVAGSAEEFASALDTALREDARPESTRARVEFGFRNTWEDRVKLALGVLDDARRGPAARRGDGRAPDVTSGSIGGEHGR